MTFSFTSFKFNECSSMVISDNTRSQGSEASEIQRVTPSRAQTQRNVNRQGYSSGASVTTGDPWLCTHYKRGCFVRFNCCERFWPCHRCHNNKSTCGRRKLKSRDVVLIKCVSCQREQPVGVFSRHRSLKEAP